MLIIASTVMILNSFIFCHSMTYYGLPFPPLYRWHLSLSAGKTGIMGGMGKVGREQFPMYPGLAQHPYGVPDQLALSEALRSQVSWIGLCMDLLVHAC